MLRATKVRIYPTPDQVEFLNAQFGAVRFAYNKALHIKSHFYRFRGLNLKPKKDIKPLLAVAKKSARYEWLKHYDSIALQQAVINLDEAYNRFFKKQAGHPKFKSKHGRQSSYHCVGVRVFDEAIKIPKLDPIPAKIHRSIAGQLKSITLSRSATGKYYASILIEDGQSAPEKPHKIESVTGIDLGIKDFAIESDGSKHANPKFTLRAEKNLRRKQKALSRKKKGSSNRAKARLTVAKCHEKVANARNDYQHKLSKKLIDENQAVIVETLKSANMLKNKKLSKHIADASWHSFVSKLNYKAEAKGVCLVRLDQWYASSKLCSCCGYKLPSLKLSARSWDCPECKTQHDRDINAAINIRNRGEIELKAAGHVVTACGGLRQSRSDRVAACEARSIAL